MAKTKKTEEKEVREDGKIVLDKFKGAKRFLSKDLRILTDLFKLEPALMIKNVGVSFKRPNYMQFDHCHYFRTYDSKGQKMTRTNVVGGHFHDMEIFVKEDGTFGARCSPPMQNERSERITPLNRDNHTHDVKYVTSEEIEIVKMKPEAIADFNQGMHPNIGTDLSDVEDAIR